MKKKIINGLKYWGQLLLLPVYWLSFLVPGNKNIWVFGSTFGRRFADNPRYFYLYVSQHSAYQSDKLAQRVDAYGQSGSATIKKLFLFYKAMVMKHIIIIL